MTCRREAQNAWALCRTVEDISSCAEVLAQLTPE